MKPKKVYFPPVLDNLGTVEQLTRQSADPTMSFIQDATFGCFGLFASLEGL